MENVNTVHRSRLTPLEKLAIWVTEKIGTMGFFLVILGWTGIWMAWNTLGPVNLRFDPYPAFVLWLFISNLIQIHLLPLIMIGQNIQGRHAELRAEYDYETNRKAEKEIESVMALLENQNKLLKEIEKKVYCK